jgi:hypothetical protein
MERDCPTELGLMLRRELALEIIDGLLRRSLKPIGLPFGLGDREYLSGLFCGRCKLLSLGVRLRRLTGLKSRRRRLLTGETDRDLDRPREERRDR